MKLFYIIVFILFGFQTANSQNPLFEAYDIVRLSDFDETMHVSNRLIEVTDDGLLLIGTALSAFYLYDLNTKKLIAQKQLDCKLPSDIIKSKDQKYFIINDQSGIVVLDRTLNVHQEIKVESSFLMEIKLSKKGTVFQRTKNEIREIDLKKGKVIKSFSFKEEGYDIEMFGKKQILLTADSCRIILKNSQGKSIKSIQPIEASNTFARLIIDKNIAYAPLPFQNKVLKIGLNEETVEELKTTSPFSLMKLKSGELIVGNGNGEVLVYRDDKLIQTITQQAFQYEIQYSSVYHMEMDEQEDFLVFSADSSPTVYIYKKKE